MRMNANEKAVRDRWLRSRLLSHESAVPYSFTLDGRSSRESRGTAALETAPLGNGKTLHRRTVEHANSVFITCEAVVYESYPVAEWTLYIHNRGTEPTGIWENLLPLDDGFEGDREAEFALRHQAGSHHAINDFEPVRETLETTGDVTRLSSIGGRPSNGSFPYFNVELGGEGVICAIGWPGQWAASFGRDGDRVRISAGQEGVRLKLLPGERIRTPLIALLFWEGDPIRGHNLFRRWMKEHNVPRPRGEALDPMTLACSSHQFSEMEKANEFNQKQFVDRYLEEGIDIDYWWMDAGWYPNRGTWVNTGTWEVDTERFPNGLRAITDHARSKGVKSIVWFEPERVTEGSALEREHADWLLPPPAEKPEGHNVFPNWRLLDYGNERARRWWTDYVVETVNREGIDIYRQDFNVDPLSFWQRNDAEDRQGMTEIRHVEGLLAFYDELRERTGGILIDNCASGGRRLDLESMRRSVPLTRSDYHFEPVGQQGQTYGLSLWFTYHGAGVMHADAYRYHSAIAPNNILCFDMRDSSLDYEAIRERMAEWGASVPFFDKDFYPLTPYSAADDVWMAWQFDSPEAGEGLVMAFRRSGSPANEFAASLRGLDPQAEYEWTEIGDGLRTTPSMYEAEGESGGLRIALEPGSSILLKYRQK